MPVMRECYTCGDSYDDTYVPDVDTEFWRHYVVCDARGCGEYYCPASPVCTYCNGHGYDDEEEWDTGNGEGIHSYDYRPTPLWHGGRDRPYYLGFELEISADRYDTSPISNWCDDNGHPGMLYCKEDGSVDGFEIVSHPMTPEYFDSVNWDSFFTMLGSNYPLPPGQSDENRGHGLHVHVSRTAFPHNSTLARWSYLLNKNQRHVERVARRSNSNWARFTEFPVSLCLPYERQSRNRGHWHEDIDNPLRCGCCYERTWVPEALPERIRRQFQTRAYPERYQAVNLTNTNTVEVRVFRSTRKPSEFIASLHLVAATVEFVRTMQPWHATRHATTWDSFAEYVAAHPVFSKESEVLAGVSPKPVTLPSRTIREWARIQGFPIGTRGRIPSHIQAAWLAASAI